MCLFKYRLRYIEENTMTRKMFIVNMLTILMAHVLFGATITEVDFETTAGYSTDPTEFIETNYKYFTRTDGSDISGESYSNIQGSYYFTVHDVDSMVTLLIQDVDISAYGSLAFEVYLAEDDASDGQDDWDGDNYVHFDYQIDGGSFTNLLHLESDAETDGAPRVDTNFDGVGDGTVITSTFALFSENITGTGNLLTIRVNFYLNSGNESIAIDNAKITGTEVPLPITLTSFTAEAKNGVVELAWETASEVNNARFVIYRNDVAIASVEGAGTTSEPSNYSYVDAEVVPGVAYTYVLADVDYANVETKYDDDAVTVTLASDVAEADFVVGDAYPNPFNPTALLPLTLSKDAMVEASVYDLLGREVKALVNGNFSAGTHELTIDGSNMTTGIYLVKVVVDNVADIQKIALMK